MFLQPSRSNVNQQHQQLQQQQQQQQDRSRLTLSSAAPQSSSTTTMMTPPRRHVMNREISKEDFDLETTLMQKDLDNLKEMLSGQITFDTNILSNLFNPEEPLASYFGAASSANNDFLNSKLPLGLENSNPLNNPSNDGMLDQVKYNKKRGTIK